MQTFLAPTFQCDWCKLGSLCNGIECVNFFHRFLEHTKRMITKYSCLDIGNASKRELQATSLCRQTWLPTPVRVSNYNEPVVYFGSTHALRWLVILSADANWFGDQVSRITPLGIIQWCQKVTTSAFWKLATTMNP